MACFLSCVKQPNKRLQELQILSKKKFLFLQTAWLYHRKKLKDFSLSSVPRQSTLKANYNLFQNIPSFVVLPLLGVSVFYSPLPCTECSPWWVGCSYYVQTVGENSGFFPGHSKILAVLKKVAKTNKKKQNQTDNQLYLFITLWHPTSSWNCWSHGSKFLPPGGPVDATQTGNRWHPLKGKKFVVYNCNAVT